MANPARKYRKAGLAAQRIAGPAGTVRAYAAGRAQARMTTGAWIVLGLFGTAFVIALSQGVLLFPGVLVGLLMYSMVRPVRGIAVADAGVLIFSASVWSGKPDQVLAYLPFPAIYPPYAQAGKSSVRIYVGPDQMVMRRNDYDYLVAASVTPPQVSGFAATGVLAQV